MKKILIGMPTFDRRIDIEIVQTMINLERSGKYEFDYVFPVSSHLSRNRNLCVKAALDGGHDYVFFWDSDVSIPGTDFLEKMLETSYRFDAAIVCGAYKIREPQKDKYPLGIDVGDKRENLSYISSPRLVDYGGTGIMLIKTEVFRVVADPWFTIQDGPNLEVFPEDWVFCKKAREAGFKIAADPRFETRHYGQRAWVHAA